MSSADFQPCLKHLAPDSNLLSFVHPVRQVVGKMFDPEEEDTVEEEEDTV